MIPKEAPWKTSALNERTYWFGEFSTVTSGTERERGFVGTFLAVATFCLPNNLNYIFAMKELKDLIDMKGVL